jgi:hypothetical protein
VAQPDRGRRRPPLRAPPLLGPPAGRGVGAAPRADRRCGHVAVGVSVPAAHAVRHAGVGASRARIHAVCGPVQAV